MVQHHLLKYEMRISLFDIYDERELEDETEMISQLVNVREERGVVYDVFEVDPKTLMANDHETVLEVYNDHATSEQRRIVKHKMRVFNNDRIVVTSSGAVIDGNHHAVAAALLDKKVKAINLQEPIEVNERRKASKDILPAIKLFDGEIISCRGLHVECMEQAANEGKFAPDANSSSDLEDGDVFEYVSDHYVKAVGFVTEEGTWLDRKDAYEYADKHNLMENNDDEFRELDSIYLKTGSSSGRTGVSKMVDIDTLPMETVQDIAYYLTELSGIPELKGKDPDDIPLLDLVEPVVLRVEKVSTDKIKGFNRRPSEQAVRKYMGMIEEGQEAPPVLVSGDTFLDGGHRLEAYRRLGEDVPVVDIKPLIDMDWRSWLRGETDSSHPVRSR